MNRNYKKNGMVKFILIMMLGVMLSPNQGFALGLGDIQVNSTLNQRFDARINLLSVGPEEAEAMIVKLASREAFIKAGMDRPHELSSLKFGTLVEGKRVYITVVSPKPIIEPALNILLDVDWPNGHLIRHYTILLDPPVSIKKKGSHKTTLSSDRPAVTNLKD